MHARMNGNGTSQTVVPRPPRILFPHPGDEVASVVAHGCQLRGFQVIREYTELKTLFDGQILPRMVLILYSSKDIHTLRYGGEHAQTDGYGFLWHWVVGVGAKLCKKKDGALDRAVDHINHTFSATNFERKFKEGQAPWGNVPKYIKGASRNVHANYFGSRVVFPAVLSGK